MKLGHGRRGISGEMRTEAVDLGTGDSTREGAEDGFGRGGSAWARSSSRELGGASHPWGWWLQDGSAMVQAEGREVVVWRKSPRAMDMEIARSGQPRCWRPAKEAGRAWDVKGREGGDA